MPQLTLALTPNKPDPALLQRLRIVKPLCLGAIAFIALLNLFGDLVPAVARVFPGGSPLMGADAVVCAILCCGSLYLGDPSRSQAMRRLSLALACLAVMLSAAIFLANWFPILPRFGWLVSIGHGSRIPNTGAMSAGAAGAFVLLGLAIALVRSKSLIVADLADLSIFCLGLVVLVIDAEYVYRHLPFFSGSLDPIAAPQTLFCLSALSQVALFSRAEFGVYSILLGRGIGSRIARIFSPFLLAFPFLQEAAQVHFINAGQMPASDAAAILAALTAMISFGLLLFIAWRITTMETEIRDLSLRDELTGLYNLRGFHLLADQSLRMAWRSQVPFSVLFIDLDNMKQINDTLGHKIGSQTLTEAAQVLNATFRESDVVGRIGGDEFAVAGQFSQDAVALATQRLRDEAVARNSQPGHPATLSFSIGSITTEFDERESLIELLNKADNAMYKEKRGKKSRRA